MLQDVQNIGQKLLNINIDEGRECHNSTDLKEFRKTVGTIF